MLPVFPHTAKVPRETGEHSAFRGHANGAGEAPPGGWRAPGGEAWLTWPFGPAADAGTSGAVPERGCAPWS